MTRLPALGEQRSSGGLRRVHSTQRGQCEAPRRPTSGLDLADRHVEMTAVVTRYGTQMCSVDHDDNLRTGLAPARRECGGLRRSGFGGFDPARDAVQPVPHAGRVGRRARQEHLKQSRRLARRGPRAQLGLQPPQFPRAAVRQHM